MTENLTAKVTIAAPPERVFAALSQPNQLTAWFAEHADIDLANGRYSFSGRYLPDVATAEQQLLAYEPGHLLRFTWQLRDASTTVEFRVEPDAAGSLAVLSHANLPERRFYEASWRDFWLATLGNLRYWVEQGEPGPRIDFSGITPGEVRLSVDIAAPAPAVFAALSEPEQLDRYISTAAQVERRVGGKIDFGWGMGPIKILELVENERLAYSWNHYPDPEPETVVTWSLSGSGGRTRLVMVHSGFAPDVKPQNYAAGWMHLVGCIKFMLEAETGWVKAYSESTPAPEVVAAA